MKARCSGEIADADASVSPAHLAVRPTLRRTRRQQLIRDCGGKSWIVRGPSTERIAICNRSDLGPGLKSPQQSRRGRTREDVISGSGQIAPSKSARALGIRTAGKRARRRCPAACGPCQGSGPRPKRDSSRTSRCGRPTATRGGGQDFRRAGPARPPYDSGGDRARGAPPRLNKTPSCGDRGGSSRLHLVGTVDEVGRHRPAVFRPWCSRSEL